MDVPNQDEYEKLKHTTTSSCNGRNVYWQQAACAILQPTLMYQHSTHWKKKVSKPDANESDSVHHNNCYTKVCWSEVVIICTLHTKTKSLRKSGGKWCDGNEAILTILSRYHCELNQHDHERKGSQSLLNDQVSPGLSHSQPTPACPPWPCWDQLHQYII